MFNEFITAIYTHMDAAFFALAFAWVGSWVAWGIRSTDELEIETSEAVMRERLMNKEWAKNYEILEKTTDFELQQMQDRLMRMSTKLKEYSDCEVDKA